MEKEYVAFVLIQNVVRHKERYDVGIDVFIKNILKDR